MRYTLRLVLMILCVLFVFSVPLLAIVGLTGWSPFGMFDWFHEWIHSNSGG
jgi:hypothetical protein